MRKVEARHLFRFSDLIDDRYLVCASAIAGSEVAVAILSSKEKQYGWLEHKESNSRTARRGWIYHYQVHCWIERDCSTLDLVETGREFHQLERLGEEGWLLAGFRVLPRQKRNAVIFDREGRLIDTLFLSDAIRNLQATPDGKAIWVGYSDEGIFSKYDLSREGLVCFNRKGQPVCRYHTQLLRNDPFELDLISDCYALNVANDQDVWLYYYRSFSLVKIQNGTIRKVWHDPGVIGSTTFAITEERALFGCGYNEDYLHLVTLNEEGGFQEPIFPIDVQGNEIPVTRQSFARGARLYLPRGDDLFLLELDYDL